MKTAHSIPLLTLVALLTGCSTMEVRTDFDPQAGFGDLNTYGWMEGPARSEDTARPGRRPNELMRRRIERAVDAELTRKGYRKTSEDPDFKVGMHTIVDQKVDVDYVNNYYGYRRRTWVVREAIVEEYLHGTLILDVVDAKRNDLIWRGWASDALPDNPTPEKIEQKVSEAVSKILERFPPAETQ